jgi:peptide/nickel transport system substrate-binding protein
VRSVDIIAPYRLRFVLDAPWPDFLVFYATPATGAAWIVHKKYIDKVGEEGFKRQPVGLGPYRFVRMTPGVELVLEANEPAPGEGHPGRHLVARVSGTVESQVSLA